MKRKKKVNNPHNQYLHSKLVLPRIIETQLRKSKERGKRGEPNSIDVVIIDQAYVPIVVSGSIVFGESPSHESPAASPRLGPAVNQSAKGQGAPWIVRSTNQGYNQKMRK